MLKLEMHLDENGNPAIMITLGSEDKGSEAELFLYFLQLYNSDKLNLSAELFQTTELALPRHELPELYQQNENLKLDMKKIPNSYKNKTLNFVLNLKKKESLLGENINDDSNAEKNEERK